MKRVVPQSAASVQPKGKQPRAASFDFSTLKANWRIGQFDIHSKWGLEAIQGPFIFHLNDEILEIVVKRDNNDLFNTLESLNDKTFNSVSDFWKKLSAEYNKSLFPDEVYAIESQIVRNNFETIILPKLKNFEQLTWREISQLKHPSKGGTKSNNHEVSVSKFIKEARDRLCLLKMDDVDTLYSLRLEPKVRIYGILNTGTLDIIWLDMNHEIYPTNP